MKDRISGALMKNSLSGKISVKFMHFGPQYGMSMNAVCLESMEVKIMFGTLLLPLQWCDG